MATAGWVGLDMAARQEIHAPMAAAAREWLEGDKVLDPVLCGCGCGVMIQPRTVAVGGRYVRGHGSRCLPPRPAKVFAAAVPALVDRDGFWHYSCRECDGVKMAALFLPEQIATGELRCRVCMGEIHSNPHRAGKATRSAQQWVGRDAQQVCRANTLGKMARGQA